MSQPTPESAHIDAALTMMSVGFKNQMYIADRVFPTVPVNKQSDYYYQFLKGAWFRNEAGVRGPGARAARGGYPLTTGTYTAKEYAFAHPIPIELINNADVVLRPWETAVRFTVDKIMLAKEKVVSDLVVNTSNWTSTNDAEGLWAATDATNTFIADVLTYKEVIRKLIGVFPNCLLMDTKTFNALKQATGIIDRIKYTGTMGRPADVTLQTLAALLELDEVMLGGAIYSSAKEAKAGTDFTAVDLWEKTATKGSALLYYRPPAPAVEVPSAGYCFNWKGAAGMLSQVAMQDVFRTVRKWWEEAEKQWVVEGSEYFDAKVVCADAGCLFYDTILN